MQGTIKKQSPVKRSTKAKKIKENKRHAIATPLSLRKQMSTDRCRNNHSAAGPDANLTIRGAMKTPLSCKQSGELPQTESTTHITRVSNFADENEYVPPFKIAAIPNEEETNDLIDMDEESFEIRRLSQRSSSPP